MDSTKDKNEFFLTELCRVVDGDITLQVSMYDVGAAIGMDRDEASRVAEDLIVDGLVELVSLSGGVSITSDGLQSLNHQSGKESVNSEILKLGTNPILDKEKCKVVEETLYLYKDAVQNTKISYSRLEEIIFDIKTLETQLLSNKPKNAIIKAVLASLAGYASEEKLDELTIRLQEMIAT